MNLPAAKYLEWMFCLSLPTGLGACTGRAGIFVKHDLEIFDNMTLHSSDCSTGICPGRFHKRPAYSEISNNLWLAHYHFRCSLQILREVDVSHVLKCLTDLMIYQLVLYNTSILYENLSCSGHWLLQVTHAETHGYRSIGNLSQRQI